MYSRTLAAACQSNTSNKSTNSIISANSINRKNGISAHLVVVAELGT
jgi:hypothetical protein